MKPRFIVVFAYVVMMLGLTAVNTHMSASRPTSNERGGITWSRFSEAPTCIKGIDDLPLNSSVMTLTQMSPARIEVDTVARCEEPFEGYVTDFEGYYVLLLTPAPYLVGSFQYETSLCLCPHRFVYEFGPKYMEGNKAVFVKDGFVSASLGEL
jgi:hypothetical protein